MTNGSVLQLGGWYTGAPYDAVAPLFRQFVSEGEAYLQITSQAAVQNYGKWLCDVDGIAGGATYRFRVEYLAEGIFDENDAISAILTWQDGTGGWLVRDYADDIFALDDGWRRLSRTIDAPEGAARLTIELVMKWTPCGGVTWRRPEITVSDPIIHRVIRVATTFIQPKNDMNRNLHAMLRVLDKAGQCRPDIVCLTENFYNRDTELPLDAVAEPIPGALTGKIGRKAAQVGCYVVFSMIERDGGYFYNTGVLIDRRGRVAGKYRKTHLALFEGEQGVSPGDQYPVFDTDFGKIGILICWDSWFPEPARILREKGAEILFVPTAGDGLIQTTARAVDNGIHVVAAGTNGGPASSRIIDPTGTIIGKVKNRKEAVVCRAIDLDKRFYQYWHSVGPAFGEPKSIYLKELRRGSCDLEQRR